MSYSPNTFSRWSFKITDIIPANKKNIWINDNYKLQNTNDIDEFTEIMNRTIDTFPLSKSYFNWWTDSNVINRAFPLLSGKSEKLLSKIKDAQNDIEFMHRDIKSKNYGLKRDTSFLEVVKALYNYSNSLFVEQRQKAVGYKTRRPRVRVRKSGGIDSGRGPDKREHFIRARKSNKYKFTNFVLKGSMATLPKHLPGKQWHKFKLHSSSIEHSGDLIEYDIIQVPMVSQNKKFHGLACRGYSVFTGSVFNSCWSWILDVLDYKSVNKNGLKTSDISDDIKTKLAGFTNDLNDTPTANKYLYDINNYLLSTNTANVPTAKQLRELSALQNVLSCAIENCVNLKNENICVLEHVKNIEEHVEDVEVIGMLEPLMNNMSGCDATKAFVLNTSTTGTHWRNFMFYKTDTNYAMITSNSLKYTKYEQETVDSSVRFFRVYITATGLLKIQSEFPIIISSLTTMRRIVNQIDCETDDFWQMIGDTMNECMSYSDEFQASASEMTQIQTKIRSIMNIEINTGMRTSKRIRLKLHQQQNLIITIPSSKYISIYNELNEVHQKIFLNSCLYQIKDRVSRNIDMAQIEVASKSLFADDSDCVINTFRNLCNHINNLSSLQDSTFSIDDTEQLNSLHEDIKHTVKLLRKIAYAEGFAALNSFV